MPSHYESARVIAKFKKQRTFNYATLLNNNFYMLMCLYKIKFIISSWND